MSPKKRFLVAAILILVGGTAAWLWGTISGWPIIRDGHYRELIHGFQQAQRRDNLWRGDRKGGWDFQIGLAQTRTTVQISAFPYMSVVRVKYDDEIDVRDLYEYVDYSHPSEIRTAVQLLYVHWSETLLHTDHWILLYDLAARREIARRRIDPRDLANSG
jgi:hypothetical protein